MTYVARHYISVAGRTITPGEVFEAEFERDTLSRLLRLGAVETCKSNACVKSDAGTDGDDSPRKAPEETEDETNNGEIGDPDEADDGEADKETPEIDVSEGIVEQPAPTAEAKTAKPKQRQTASRRK